MSALIPMTKLPDNCAIGGRDSLGCPCFCNYNEECQLLGETVHTAYFSDEKRPERCPLQFVPPHGRLIDADALKEMIEALIEKQLHGYTKSTWDFVCELRSIISDAPTIIPAEEVEA